MKEEIDGYKITTIRVEDDAKIRKTDKDGMNAGGVISGQRDVH